MTQKERVLASLQKGNSMTAKQIAARFKIASPSKVISRIRQDGHNVQLAVHKDSKGRVTNKYSLI